MFFYLNSLDFDVIGKTDGISQINLDRSRISPEFSTMSCLPKQVKKNLSSCKAVAPFKTVSTKTILTDFCFGGEASYMQRVVSKKVKVILEQFQGFESYFYPTEVYDTQGNTHRYFLLHFQEALPDKFINFDNCVYSQIDKRGEIINEVTGKRNLPEDKSTAIRVKRFAFNKGVDFPDFFVSPLNNHFFISDEIADAFTASRVSGIDIYHYDILSDLGVNEERSANKRLR